MDEVLKLLAELREKALALTSAEQYEVGVRLEDVSEELFPTADEDDDDWGDGEDR